MWELEKWGVQHLMAYQMWSVSTAQSTVRSSALISISMFTGWPHNTSPPTVTPDTLSYPWGSNYHLITVLHSPGDCIESVLFHTLHRFFILGYVFPMFDKWIKALSKKKRPRDKDVVLNDVPGDFFPCITESLSSRSTSDHSMIFFKLHFYYFPFKHLVKINILADSSLPPHLF